MTRLPITAAAEGIQRGQRLDPGYPGYWTAECAEILGAVDVDRLAEAVTATVREAEALHARFDDDGQRLGPTDWRCEVVRLPTAAGWDAVHAEIERDLAVPVDLAAGSLFASTLFVTADRVYWYIRAHHIVLDGFGYALLYRQVSRRYGGQRHQAFGRLADLVAEDLGYRDGDQAAIDREYWLRQLSNLPVAGFAETTALPDREVIDLDLPAELLAGAGPGWPHRLVALVAAALHRRTGTATPVLGLPVSGRLGTVAARVPAMVMNIVPVPVPIGLADTVADVTATVAARLRDSRAHQRYRYEWLRGDLGLSAGRGRVFGPVVNIIPFAEPPQFAGHEVRMRHLSAGPVDDLAITARGADRLTLSANPRLYSPSDLESIRDELVAVAGAGRVSPWRELPAAPAPESRPLPELIDEHDADAIAIVADGESLTYGELRQRASQVAARLTARGVVPGELVAVALPRGIPAIVAMAGVLYAGAGYLPLDPNGAAERNAAILAEAAPRLVIDADFGLSDGLGAPGTTAADPVEGRPIPGSGRDAGSRSWHAADPAYVIYTSGSTGRPKGVAVPRSALDFFVATAARRYGFSPDDRVLQFAPLHFDAHVEEVFVSLAVGATIVVRDDSATESLSGFARFLAAQRITVLDLPTAYWHELVLATVEGQFRLPEPVSTVIIGGEAAIPERVAQWHAAVGDSVRLVNSYGPTEATVVCLAADLAPGGPVNLGKPLAGVRAAIGPADELYLAGPGLASGYLGGPAETGSAPPTGHTATGPGTDADPFLHFDDHRWYRTGDLVALTDTGDLAYRGRRDDELKISGHRVHPAEVEAALLRHPEVREVVVSVERSPRTRLVAHAATALDATALRDHARRHLPEAAVPASIHVLDRLPRTGTGKLDRRALTDRAEAVAEPATEAERAVVTVFAEVLGRAVSPGEDFFAVGGTSLTAIAAATRLSAAFDREVTAAQLFAHPSAAELAAVVTGAAAGVDEDALLRADRIWRPDTIVGPPNGERAITLTGATGFVGSHLLEALLTDTDRPIRCLVRGGAGRLVEAARRFGLPDPDPKRVTVIDGDMSRPVLGLDSRAMALISDSGAIVNCAAGVSFTRGYAGLRAVNVEAVRTLLELACVGGVAFHQVSTVSVGGGAQLPEDFIAEHPGLVDGYQRGKWVAEELVRQAGDQGLPVSVYRLGRVVPPLGACAHNPEDFVAHLIRASLLLGATPELAVSEPWIAADVAADCVVAGVRGHRRGVWNLSGGEVSLSTVWQRLRRDHPGLDALPVERWRRRLGEHPDTAILKSFFDIHAGGPPRGHRIRTERFADWFADSGRPAPAWNLDWCSLVGR